jgi:hypothetical protein
VKKVYVYFVSYDYVSDEPKAGGQGRCEVSTESLIKNIKDIAVIEKNIKKLNKFSSVLINNWQLLRTEEL